MPWQRVITALILLPIVILAIFNLAIELFAVAVGIILATAAWEWSGLFTDKKRLRFVYILSVVLIMWCIQLFSLPMTLWHGFILPETISDWFAPNQMALDALILGSIWWLFAIILLMVYPRISQSILGNPFWIVPIGWLMIIPAWVGIVGIRSMSITFDPLHGAKLLLFVLLLVWAADTGAYIAGKSFGKTKLAPKISPKKTWEGVFGGLTLALVVLAASFYLLHFTREQWLPLITLTIIIVAFSVVGDLTESIFKRLTGKKDSGRILPGHGGILDRIDGVIAVLPIALLGFSVLGIK